MAKRKHPRGSEGFDDHRDSSRSEPPERLQSTGPRSAEGIEAARFNALRHGLRSLQTVVPGEAPEEWEAHRAAVVVELKPEALKIGILALVNTGLRLTERFGGLHRGKERDEIEDEPETSDPD